MTYLPCAMVYVSQYMYFGFAKSVLLGDTVRGVFPGVWEQLQSRGKGRVAVRTGSHRHRLACAWG